LSKFGKIRRLKLHQIVSGKEERARPIRLETAALERSEVQVGRGTRRIKDRTRRMIISSVNIGSPAWQRFGGQTPSTIRMTTAVAK
jgi:hypothetical protein